MNVKSAALMIAALAVLGTLATVSAASPQFKYHATTVGMIVLGVIALTGILAALIAPMIPDRRPPDPRPETASADARARHTGAPQ